MPTNQVPIRARIGPNRRARKKDPREAKVQVNVTVPHWYREQLYDYCDETGKSFAAVVIGSLLDRVPPRKPGPVADWPPAWYYSDYVEPQAETEP